MPKVYAHKIRIKGKTYFQFQTKIPKWVINNLKLAHGDEIEFKVSKRTGNIEIHKIN